MGGWLAVQQPPPPPEPPGNSRVHPSSSVWAWTEEHVGDPSLLAQSRTGYIYRLTVGCGSLQEAVGTRTHDH